MPSGRAYFCLLRHRILSSLPQKNKYVLFQMALFLRPLLCSGHANVFLPTSPYSSYRPLNFPLQFFALRRYRTIHCLSLYGKRLRQMVYLPRSRNSAPCRRRRVYPYRTRYAMTLIATGYSPIIHFPQVHALYDRNRNVTVPLVVLFFLENLAMMLTLIFVVPGVHFDATCTVVRSPPTLIIFAYGHIPLTACAILILVFYSAAFVSFESVLFVLTLIKFIVALRSGWGRTPVVFLLVRDGTWAFILIFGSLPLPFSFSVILAHLPHFPQQLSASTQGFISVRETQPSQPLHSRGYSRSSLLRVHALCSIFTQFPPIFRPTLLAQPSMAHYPHTSCSRHTRRRKATARIPRA